MLIKLFVGLFIVAGVIAGALALTLPREQIVHLIMFRDFFDVALPILGFGALIKYLCAHKSCPNCDKKL